jgi:hypothetical protein
METTSTMKEAGIGFSWLGDGQTNEPKPRVLDCEQVGKMSLAEALYWVLTAGRGGETLAQG